MHELTNISQLTAEIVLLKNQTAQNIIEIGKRLIEVKEQLPHGEWGKWLEDKVEFHQTTASKFMKVAIEFSNQASMLNLGTAKVFALLDLPQDQREDFIQSNPVDEMTTRQLAQAIKDKKEAERQLEAERNKPPRIIENVREKLVIPDDYEELKKQLQNLEAMKLQLASELESKSKAEKELDEIRRKFKENDADKKRLEEKIAEVGEARIRLANRTTFRTKVNEMLVAVAKGIQEATNCVGDVELEEVALQIKRINETLNQAIIDAKQWTFIEGGQYEHIEYVEV